MSCFTVGIRYVTNQSPSIPLLADDSAQEEEEEEEDESHEMVSIARCSRESHIGEGWRWTTTLLQ